MISQVFGGAQGGANPFAGFGQPQVAPVAQ
jgi:hypothetical protein